MKTIDLRSDTATRPSAAMRWAMLTAEVGDDMLGEDPTVNLLESTMAALLGKEAAAFACSGTQSNQMAIQVHCQPGDELLINESGHIANFEAGAPAALSGVTVRTITAPDGLLDVEHLEGRIRPVNQHYCRTRLVCLENTTNLGGGRAYSLEQMQRVSQWARSNNLRLHLDGARLFNAVVARGYSAADAAACFDTISVCFSKGLGCPMGSVLVGSAEDIARARRSRKILGGALRQAGVIAATALYALKHNINRLADDHENARLLADRIAAIPGIHVQPETVETNLVFFALAPEYGTAAQLVTSLKERGVLVGSHSRQLVRAVTHMDVSAEDIETAAITIAKCLADGIRDRHDSAGGAYSAPSGTVTVADARRMC